MPARPLTPRTTVNSTGPYGQTVVTALAGGGYVVSRTEDNAAADPVMGRAMGANDVPLGAAFEISTATLSSNYYSDGALTLANGNVVFAWDGPSSAGSGLGSEVYMRLYDFSGPAPGTPGPGPDSLNGTSGNDTLNGLGGADTMAAGSATISISSTMWATGPWRRPARAMTGSSRA